jgi:hypothetical protein
MNGLKSLIRVFISAQKMTGYDPYPVVYNQLTEPLSGTVTDMTTVYEHRVRIQEWSETRPETESVTGAEIPLRESAGSSSDLAGSYRTSLTWELMPIFKKSG